jgi:hypothetical protein
MKKTARYKIYIKSNKITNLFPQRLKYFYRTKWRKFISKNRYRIRRYRFINLFFRTFARKKKRFVRMKRYYKQSLLDKNCLLQNFDNSYRLLLLKKDLLKSNNFKYSDILKLTLIKQNYYLNIFLWRLLFFKTTNEASYCINNNFVQVNGVFVTPNYFLKSGDIITFKKDTFFYLKKNFRSYKLLRTLYSFVEIDYYLFSIVVIKDFDEFTIDDFCFFLPNTINVTSICNSLK